MTVNNNHLDVFRFIICNKVLILYRIYLLIYLLIYNSNYNYNYKISIAPISSKRIELGGAPVTGVGQTQMIRSSRNVGRISESEKVSFQMVTQRNYFI